MQSLYASISVVLVMFLTAFPHRCEAAHTPFVATIDGDHANLLQLMRKPARVGNTFSVLRFRSPLIPGIGTANFVFNSRKLPAAEAVIVGGGRAVHDRIVPTLLKGYVYLNRGSGRINRVPAALSVIKGIVRVRFSTVQLKKTVRASRLFSLTWSLKAMPSLQARVSREENASLREKACDSHAHSESRPLHTLSIAAAKTQTRARIVTISTDADPEWYAKYGDASNAEIAAIINAAEAIFERQLGIRFALVRQHVYSGASTYTSTDASELLASFKNNPENPANLGYSPETFDVDVDVKHLFTGKDLKGNVIGLSYVGAICWSAKNAYGLTQNTSRDLNVTTFLHEVAHTLGAAHDSSDPEGIMYPTLGIKRHFSTTSVNQIEHMLSTHGKCISEELIGANLSNATITLKQRRVRKGRAVLLTGKLASNLATPLSGEVVKLKINRKIVFLVTDDRGIFSYRLRLAKNRGRGTRVVAQTMNKEIVVSRVLKVPLRI